MDKIIKMPITYSQRKKNEMGKGYVPCQISQRYLKIYGINKVGGKNFVMFDVMTENEENKHKKICQMAIALEDFNEALKEVTKE